MELPGKARLFQCQAREILHRDDGDHTGPYVVQEHVAGGRSKDARPERLGGVLTEILPALELCFDGAYLTGLHLGRQVARVLHGEHIRVQRHVQGPGRRRPTEGSQLLRSPVPPEVPTEEIIGLDEEPDDRDGGEDGQRGEGIAEGDEDEVRNLRVVEDVDAEAAVERPTRQHPQGGGRQIPAGQHKAGVLARARSVAFRC